jgi:hypothetical protein
MLQGLMESINDLKLSHWLIAWNLVSIPDNMSVKPQNDILNVDLEAHSAKSYVSIIVDYTNNLV